MGVVTDVRVVTGIKKGLIELILEPSVFGEAIVNNKHRVRNKLLRNFYQWLQGFIKHVNTTAKDINGDTYEYGITNYGAYHDPRIRLSSATSLIPFDGHSIDSIEDVDPVTADILDESTQSVARLVATFTSGGNSVGTIVRYNDSVGKVHFFLFNHVLLSVVAGDTINVRFVFKLPWLKNMASAFLSDIYCSTRFDLVDVTGGAYTTQTGENPTTAGAPKIVIGDDNTAEKPSDYTLTNMRELDTHLFVVERTELIDLIIVGYYVPPGTETLGEIGLVKPIRDSGGSPRDTLIIRKALSEPITLEANKTYTVMIRIVGS